MSNQSVGAVYHAVIEDVINASRGDFEDQGIEERVLEQLRKGWQKRLSSLHIAQFPWDPKPEPVTHTLPRESQALHTPSLPLPVHGQQKNQPQNPHQLQFQLQQSRLHQPHQPHHQHQGQQQHPHRPHQQFLPQSLGQAAGPVHVAQYVPPPMLPNRPVVGENSFALPAAPHPPTAPSAAPAYNGTDVTIKKDPDAAVVERAGADARSPGLHIKQEPIASVPHGSGSVRAAKFLKGKYGDVASASIRQMQQAGDPRHTQQRPGAPEQMVAPQQYQQQPQLGSYQQTTQMRLPKQPGDLSTTNPDFLGPSQSDGAVDLPGIPTREEIQGTRDCSVVDGLLHEQMIAARLRDEGGGLMTSIKSKLSPAGRKSSGRSDQGVGGKPSDILGDQMDGTIPEDEEAIGSDLDDSDENKDSDEDDEEGGNVMLCVYDRVQRVKNKWKCTLRDGVFTADSREYVFQKATGDFEW